MKFCRLLTLGRVNVAASHLTHIWSGLVPRVNIKYMMSRLLINMKFKNQQQ